MRRLIVPYNASLNTLPVRFRMELMVLSLTLMVIVLLASVELPDQRQRVRVIDRDTERLLERMRLEWRWME